ncbi:hypothetical protein QBC46DRAFT_319308 [Diplogelasinospora grovesii]|uniref:ER-bound oxygenase mpaB/mpaB'/Rubber oxygenase catalytic domain-containing protein n=1 Tax=Diplogelasinospora grovesii TaxID=303347 RepID=A0AAN6N2U9_9PEZI|nr:hypothetical protein QBC46DRAFT_319308 [Diplogelasinospora grovesii]
MTLQEAYEIQKWLTEQEFPTAFHASLFLALLKTYAIPSISRVLIETGLLGSSDIVKTSKRAADTSALMGNMVMAPPGSTRALEAVARTNFLHRGYIRAGKITNDDMLYTLYVLAFDAVLWIERYEWRGLTDMELCAVGTFWKALGEDLGISYRDLPHERGWSDGLAWAEEMHAWSRKYVDRCVIPSDSNEKLAGQSLDLIFSSTPRPFRAMFRGMACTYLGPKFQTAMRLPTPPAHYAIILESVLALRKFLLRNFFLPRPYLFRCPRITDQPDPATGRYYAARWFLHPWYTKRPSLERWGPLAWMAWAQGVETKPAFRPEGYLVRELGPTSKVGKGNEDMDRTIEALKINDPKRCPFAPLS